MVVHQHLIERLTLEEKASLTSGANFWNTKAIERLGIPSIILTDGPHGVRKQAGEADHLGLNKSIPATCFPPAATLAQSWDDELIERVGERLGAEARAAEVGVLLGPGLNIVRDPRGGRSFEYFSEDPLLSGRFAAALVRGIQANGVSACLKHFAVNSQEELRMSIDEVVDERSLREIYLDGFRRAIEGSAPRAIMTSYNRVNGEYANENEHLLREILREEWGYEGLVVTDWGGNHDRVAGLRAGNQLEMPSSGGVTDAEIVAAVRSGELAEEELDARVDELLTLVMAADAALHPAEPRDPVDYGEHHEFAVEAAGRSLVLLQNDGVLPLPRGARVAVIGDFAERPRYQGAGSSLVNPTRVENALDALRGSGLDVIGYEPGFRRGGRASRALHGKALALAARAETTLLFLGLDESAEAEGVDREHLRLAENQLRLVRALVDAGRRVVVVLAGGSPVELPFADGVSAILHSALAGQGGGRAVADAITGAVNPAGRLAVTYPLALADAPTARWYPGSEASAEHREGIFVGYRYYETREVPVRFPFGHGLSYTRFAYADLAAGEDGVAFTLTNVGERAGEEVAQLYVEAPESEIARAKKTLAGYARVHLEPGESRRVELPVDQRAYEYYSVGEERWVRAGGDYRLLVGGSVRDIRLTAALPIAGDEAAAGAPETIDAYRRGDVQRLSDADFRVLLGRTPPAPAWQPGPLGLDDTFAQLRYGRWWGRAMLAAVLAARRFLIAIGKPNPGNAVMFVVNAPFSKLVNFTGGKVTRARMRAFLRRVSRGR